MAVEISNTDAARRAHPAGRDSGPPVSLRVVADLLRGLNKQQRAAVTHGEGPLLVVAGPGTGKTEVITRRLAWLIATKRAKPRELLALTFTENVAEEMQGRVDMLVPYGQADTRIHTFHAFGDGVLREFAFELGLPGDVRLITRSEVIVLLRENLFDLGLQAYRPLGDPTRFLGALADVFQRAKDEDVCPQELSEWALRSAAADSADPVIWERRHELGRAFQRYEDLLHGRGLIDHGDQIALPLRLLREHPWVRDELRRRHRYVLVDEFQDLNPAQLALLGELTGSGGNVTAVGDPDQAIYTFRGAGRGNVAQFNAGHPTLKRIVLRRNYRSRQSIIDAADRLMAGSGQTRDATEVQTASRRGGSRQVRALAFDTPSDEADGIAGAISDAVAAGANPRDFAVLARSNYEVEPLAQALRVRGLPVRTHVPSDFFAHEQVRPLLALLRVVADPDQTLELYALATSFPYFLGGERLTEALAAARRSHRSLWQELARLGGEGVNTSEFDRAAAALVSDVRSSIALSHERSSTEVLYDYLRNSGRLSQLAASSDPAKPKAVARFFEIVRGRARLLAHDRVAAVVPHLDALIEAEDELADTGPLDLDAVSVLTVHRAKGLEFKIVYVTGLVDGRFPARGKPPAIQIPWATVKGRDVPASEPLEEERRLAFVAMTRARDELWLTYYRGGAEGRGRRRVSQFLVAAFDSPLPNGTETVEPVARLSGYATPADAPPGEPPSGPSGTTFSFSELETYLDCPEKYRLRHVVGLPSPPHHALTYGSAMHQAVAEFHLARKRGKAMTDRELEAAFAAAWSPEGFLSREHEEVRFRAGVDALRRFRVAAMSSPDEVIAVERPFAVRLDQLTIRGRMDRIDRTLSGAVVVDYKSSDVSDQAKADDKARNSLQLQVYAMAHEAETGNLPVEVRLHFLDTGVVGSAKPDGVRLDKARSKLHAAAQGIRAGVFAAHPTAIACGYCPFRRICASSAA